MADNINLYDLIKDFIKSRCTNEKNKSFKINYHQNNQSEEKFSYLFDETNYIFCLIKTKDSLIKDKYKDMKLQIKDSSFKLAIYKDDTNLKVIKFLLLLIVNDYTVVEEEVNKFEEEKIMDINNEEDIIDDLKLFLFNYIKENKNKIKENSFDKILLDNSKDNIKIYNDKENSGDISDQIKKIKKFESNVQINTGYCMNDILDELNPKFRENLMDKYLDEMPEEIAELAKKYKNVKFNNEMYEKYMKIKDIEVKEGEEEDDKKENIEENEEENKDLEGTPQKKEKKEKKNSNDNLSSDKKQLFKIK